MEEKKKIKLSTILAWVFAILLIASIGYIIFTQLPKEKDETGGQQQEEGVTPGGEEQPGGEVNPGGEQPGGEEAVNLDRDSVLMILENIVEDFFKESSGSGQESSTAFNSFFDLGNDLYVDLTDEIKGEIKDNVVDSSSIVSQYYSFVIKPFILGIFDYQLEFNVEEKFSIYRTLFSDELQSEPTAFGYCVTTENTILINFYDKGIITQNNGASGINILITLDESDGYVLEFMVETENGSSLGNLTYWRVVKNDNLFLENTTHDAFAELQILQYDPSSDDKHFKGIFDVNFAKEKVFAIREGSSWNYTTDPTYLQNMPEETFERLKNKFFVLNGVNTLLERNSEFFAGEIAGQQ